MKRSFLTIRISFGLLLVYAYLVRPWSDHSKACTGELLLCSEWIRLKRREREREVLAVSWPLVFLPLLRARNDAGTSDMKQVLFSRTRPELTRWLRPPNGPCLSLAPFRDGNTDHTREKKERDGDICSVQQEPEKPTVPFLSSTCAGTNSEPIMTICKDISFNLS